MKIKEIAVAVTSQIQKEELIMLVDFNSVDEDDNVLASLRHTIGWRKPQIGDWVRLDDADGHTCRGRVVSIRDGATMKGGAIKVAPEWDTLTTYVPIPPEFSVSYPERWVQAETPVRSQGLIPSVIPSGPLA